MKKFYNTELKSAGCPVKRGMTEESGRSMVEMLGVLAVIGVLSVAGIAGYTTAMKKYRANELLNEASKRATVVAMQITAGREPNIATEFTQPTGYTFGVNPYSAGDTTFSLTLSGDGLADICPMMIEATGDNSFMSIAEGCGTITFKTDLSAGGNSNNEPVVTCTPACQTNEECVNGICLPIVDNNCPREQWWDCSPKCTKNSDCNDWCEEEEYDACYCRIDGGEYTGTENACYNNFTGGSCQGITSTEISQKRSSQPMNWFNARNFCLALGSHIVEATDLCENDADATKAYDCSCSEVDLIWLSNCWCDKSNDPNCTCNDNSCSVFAQFDGCIWSPSADNPNHRLETNTKRVLCK